MEKLTSKKKISDTTRGCLIIVVIVLIIGLYIIFAPPEKQKAPSKPLYISLNASVQFTGTQFIITNNDSFEWRNVKLEINSKILKSGYKLTTYKMIAGQTYTVGSMQFAKSDGTRFNPFSMKVQSIDIYCDTSKGKASYHGSWN
ncbi:hypothetical protein ES702_03817 [subsurface metagenome]